MAVKVESGDIKKSEAGCDWGQFPTFEIYCPGLAYNVSLMIIHSFSLKAINLSLKPVKSFQKWNDFLLEKTFT